MFEISELKAKKLPELQELAKTLSVPKYRSLKKLDLVYQILDYQASNPSAVKEIAAQQKAAEAQAAPKPETKEAPAPAKENGQEKEASQGGQLFRSMMKRCGKLARFWWWMKTL